MLKNIDFDWQNALGKVWSVVQMIGWVVVLVVMVVVAVGIIFFIVIGITETTGITHLGFYTPDNRTYQQKQMDAYELFETECLSREYSKEQCLVIWSKDDD